MAAIVIKDLVHRFGSHTVLDGISFEIEDGEILAIMGTSGGGKTTLLKCISGLITPSSGSVSAAGVDVLKEPEQARLQMGMVFQSAALFDYMTVEDNVLFGLRRWRARQQKSHAETLGKILEQVGLAGTQRLMPSELSGGMRKRVGIARAIALEPKILLYDEPTTGLDPVTTYAIDSLIVDLRKSLGVTSLIVSHDVTSVYRVADRIAFLEQGKLSFLGAPKDFGSARSAAIQELLQKAEARSLRT